MSQHSSTVSVGDATPFPCTCFDVSQCELALPSLVFGQGAVRHSEAVGLYIHVMCRQGKYADALTAFRGPVHFVAAQGDGAPPVAEPAPEDVTEGSIDPRKVGAPRRMCGRC